MQCQKEKQGAKLSQRLCYFTSKAKRTIQSVKKLGSCENMDDVYTKIKKEICSCLNEKAREYGMVITVPCECKTNPFQSTINCEITMKATSVGIYAGVVEWYEICGDYPVEYIYAKEPNSIYAKLFAKFYTWSILGVRA